MCLYPKLIANPKYKKTKKNGGIIPPISDNRVAYVPIACTRCIECMKAKQREWRARLLEDIKHNKNGKFVTLTFSNEKYAEYYNKFKNEYQGYYLDNKIAAKAMRHFLERWRKKYKKSVRHWFITELGHGKTEHLHYHGIIWTDHIDDLSNVWQNGYVWDGKLINEQKVNYVNERTVNYITKYMTKLDEKHKFYKGVVLSSAGIGRDYTKTHNFRLNRYVEKKTIETYQTAQGTKINLPIYWRNKIYTEDEREKLWLEKLDKQERWVLGIKIDVSKGDEEYMKALERAQKWNIQEGYNGPPATWEELYYENQLRNLKQKERLGDKHK